jgi:hypothetical protein
MAKRPMKSSKTRKVVKTTKAKGTSVKAHTNVKTAKVVSAPEPVVAGSKEASPKSSDEKRLLRNRALREWRHKNADRVKSYMAEWRKRNAMKATEAAGPQAGAKKTAPKNAKKEGTA